MIPEKIPPEVRKAVSSLSSNPNFTVLKGWLDRSLAVTRVENDELAKRDLTLNQGCAITLHKISRTFNPRGASDDK